MKIYLVTPKNPESFWTYDRILPSGHLQSLCYAQGMTNYLYQHHIRQVVERPRGSIEINPIQIGFVPPPQPLRLNVMRVVVAHGAYRRTSDP